jgi:hypothetical protein
MRALRERRRTLLAMRMFPKAWYARNSPQNMSSRSITYKSTSTKHRHTLVLGKGDNFENIRSGSGRACQTPPPRRGCSRFLRRCLTLKSFFAKMLSACNPASKLTCPVHCCKVIERGKDYRFCGTKRQCFQTLKELWTRTEIVTYGSVYFRQCVTQKCSSKSRCVRELAIMLRYFKDQLESDSIKILSNLEILRRTRLYKI